MLFFSSMLSATGKAYTMLRQNEWCYSDSIQNVISQWFRIKLHCIHRYRCLFCNQTMLPGESECLCIIVLLLVLSSVRKVPFKYVLAFELNLCCTCTVSTDIGCRFIHLCKSYDYENFSKYAK